LVDSIIVVIACVTWLIKSSWYQPIEIERNADQRCVEQCQQTTNNQRQHSGGLESWSLIIMQTQFN
jgi:hypothetical protein